MSDPSPAHYDWVADLIGVAGCVTLVCGAGPAAALDAMGADSSQSVGWDDEDDGLMRVSAVPAHMVDPDAACVLVELNGWEGSRPEVLATLSELGNAASVFWNVNDVVTFGCARRGKVLVSIELAVDEDVSGLPRNLRRLLQCADPDANLVAVGMAMLEKFTGVAVQESDLNAWPITAHPVTEPVLSLWASPKELLDLEMPTSEVVAAARTATPTARRRAAEWAVRRAVDVTGLHRQVGVKSMTDQFDRDGPTRLTREVVDFGRHAERMAQESAYALAVSEEDDEQHQLLQHWSLNVWITRAIAYTTLQDDLIAVLGATYCASIPLGDGEGREEFLAESCQRLRA